MDDDDWDISSLEEEKSLGKKSGKEQKEPPPVKNELNTTQVPSAWGAPNLKGPKGEGSLLLCLAEAQSTFQLFVSHLYKYLFINNANVSSDKNAGGITKILMLYVILLFYLLSL